MKLGFIGLGKMGSQMVRRLVRDGHRVAVFDIHSDAMKLVEQYGAVPCDSKQDLVNKLGTSAIVWLMLPSGVVDTELQDLLDMLPPGSILIDGGNSDFRLTQKRARLAHQQHVHFVDVGTSGGILGLTKGFSMMVGGDRTSYEKIEPIISSLAQPDGYHYFGRSGAGHFVKMVHNAVEYGIMQSYAEGYHMLKEGAQYPNIDLAAVARVWQHGSIIKSDLNALVEKIFEQNPNLTGIDGYVAESGEARWALETAKKAKIEMPATDLAIKVRLSSQKGKTDFSTKLLAAMRRAFGGHSINKETK